MAKCSLCSRMNRNTRLGVKGPTNQITVPRDPAPVWQNGVPTTASPSYWHLNTILRMWFDLDPWGAGKSWKACSTISWDFVANIDLVSLGGHFPANASCPMGFIRRRRYLQPENYSWILRYRFTTPLWAPAISVWLRSPSLALAQPRAWPSSCAWPWCHPADFFMEHSARPFFCPQRARFKQPPKKIDISWHFTDNDFKRMLPSRSWGCYSWKTAGIQ
jgi:hypothetical protein